MRTKKEAMRSPVNYKLLKSVSGAYEGPIGMSSSESGRQFKRGFPTKCECGSGVRRFTSHTEDNPGRPFHGCDSMKKDHLFKWCDDSLLEEVEDLVSKTEDIKHELLEERSELNTMKEELYVLQHMVMEVKNEFQLVKIVCASVIGVLLLFVLAWFVLMKM